MTYSAQTEEMRVLLRWLKEGRLKKKLTMRDLAKKLDKQHSYVQKVENGDRRLDLIEYIWYCKAIGLEPVEGLEKVQRFIEVKKISQR